MSAPQIRLRVRAAGDRLAPAASHQDLTAAGQAGVRFAWRRGLCLSSFVIAGITALIVWVAITALLPAW